MLQARKKLQFLPRTLKMIELAGVKVTSETESDDSNFEEDEELSSEPPSLLEIAENNIEIAEFYQVIGELKLSDTTYI